MTNQRFRTGWTELDQYLTDLGPKRLVVVAGVPSAGMTATLLSLTESVAVAQRVPTLFVDMENGTRILENRLLACASNVDYSKIRDNRLDAHDTARIRSAQARIADAPLAIVNLPGARTVDDVRNEAMRRPEPPALIVIDGTRYLTAMDDYNEEGMARLAVALKALAGTLRCTIVMSQPLRHVEEAESRPALEHFGEMGLPFVNHADHVLLVHRPAQYSSRAEPGALEVRIAKNRHGMNGVVEFVASLSCSKLWPLASSAAAA